MKLKPSLAGCSQAHQPPVVYTKGRVMRVRFAIVGVVAPAPFCGSQGPGSVWEGVYSAEQAERGQHRNNPQSASYRGDTLSGAGRPIGELFDRTRAARPERKE